VSDSKRGKGRPKGSELDDTKVLNAVADMIVANPDLRPTTAIRKIVPQVTDAALRRYQDKWKHRNIDLLEAAKERKAAKAAPLLTRAEAIAVAAGHLDLSGLGSLHDNAALRAAAGIGGHTLAALGHFAETKAMRASAEYARGGSVRAALDQVNSPAMLALQAQMNSPAMRTLLEQMNSPAMRAIRDLADSPAIRAMREHERLLKMVRGGY
jgi:hypothetical protein